MFRHLKWHKVFLIRRVCARFSDVPLTLQSTELCPVYSSVNISRRWKQHFCNFRHIAPVNRVKQRLGVWRNNTITENPQTQEETTTCLYVSCIRLSNTETSAMMRIRNTVKLEPKKKQLTINRFMVLRFIIHTSSDYSRWGTFISPFRLQISPASAFCCVSASPVVLVLMARINKMKNETNHQ